MLAGFIAVIVAIILGAGRPSARGASPKDDSADDGRSNEADHRQAASHRVMRGCSFDVTLSTEAGITNLYAGRTERKTASRMKSWSVPL
jgi:hypothetical protein